MNTTGRLYAFAASMSVFLIAANAQAIKCPESFDSTADWDRDGIANQDDNCCFTATFQEHNDSSFCSEEAGADVNMNGILQSEEGECCITPEGSCGGAETELCEEAGSEKTSVRCDMLLFYLGMWMPSAAPVESCGEFCICFSVEDFDNDFVQTTDTFVSGSLDNCPLDDNPPMENSGQANADEDIFGDACDLCTEHFDEPIPCEMGPSEEDACPSESRCVPFVLYSEERVAVEQYCSFPRIVDEDHNGSDDRCADNADSDTGGDTDADVDTDADSDTETSSEPDSDWDCDGGAACDTDEKDASIQDSEPVDSESEPFTHDSESEADAGHIDSETGSTSDTEDGGVEDTEEKETDSLDAGVDTETEDTESAEDTDTDKDKDSDTDSESDTQLVDTLTETEEDSADSDTDSDNDTDRGDTEGIAEDVYLGGALSCDCNVSSTSAQGGLLKLIRALF